MIAYCHHTLWPIPSQALIVCERIYDKRFIQPQLTYLFFLSAGPKKVESSIKNRNSLFKWNVYQKIMYMGKFTSLPDSCAQMLDKFKW